MGLREYVATFLCMQLAANYCQAQLHPLLGCYMLWVPREGRTMIRSWWIFLGGPLELLGGCLVLDHYLPCFSYGELRWRHKCGGKFGCHTLWQEMSELVLCCLTCIYELKASLVNNCDEMDGGVNPNSL